MGWGVRPSAVRILIDKPREQEREDKSQWMHAVTFVAGKKSGVCHQDAHRTAGDLVGALLARGQLNLQDMDGIPASTGPALKYLLSSNKFSRPATRPIFGTFACTRRARGPSIRSMCIARRSKNSAPQPRSKFYALGRPRVNNGNAPHSARPFL